MGIGSWGGGIVLGIVALLWLAYLVPSWHKRQEYLATERNAVRLQQTLRILAETAEVPEAVTVEANARSVASAQKILRDEESKREAIRRAKEAARQRAVTRELAATAPVLRAAASEPALAARRLRRTRLAATLVLVLGLVALVLGLTHLTAAWLVAVAGAAAVAGSVAVLGQLAAVARARARRLDSAPTSVVAEPAAPAQALQDFAPYAHQTPVARRTLTEVDDESRAWTPVPLPRPLYLRRGQGGALARSSAALSSPVSDADVDALRAEAASSIDDLRRQQQLEAQEAQRQALRELALAEAALDAARRRADDRGSRDTSVAHPAAESAAADRVAAPAQVEAPVQVRPAAQTAAPQPPRPESRFARMGFLDETETPELQLDEILRRRRAV